MALGSLVLVDGWNHFLAVQRCFGYATASSFPLDRLARHLSAEAGAGDVDDVVVVMALPNRNHPGELPEFHAWRRRLNKLRNFGVRHEKARFSYHELACAGCRTTLDRQVACPSCGRSNPVAGRRKEKGADIRLATLALDGAWRQDYTALIVLSQDSDFGPMIRQVKEIHQRQGRRYALYSSFPVCTRPEHEHRKIPGTRDLPLDADVYKALAEKPFGA
ncbi:NYN domain-containing protein [Actinomadura algeriensis]|uniref:NYN domain-containing protein n=1 Tax=Actinomadura algeriensis TaxID=1679523 RepID=A0ABR9K1W6_9ACTN|nr:NYN domain-containing protein [Actinomadura algeriensis]MBE1536713.1 hypothetical protein [Actinomadura algeriensis]